MAQIIKHRRGSLENLSSVTGSLQKGELVFATGSSNLTTTNGSAIAFIVPESGSVQASNRFLRGTANPNVFSSSTYNGLLNGVPYYASGSSTLYLLGSDGNEAINLVGNIQPFSQSVDSRLDSLESSIGGGGSGIGSRVDALEASQSYFDGTYSGSVATQFSASNAATTALSASVASVTGNFSSSVATSFSASAASVSALSSSVATSFSASVASQTALSASIATTDSSQANRLSTIEGKYATTGSNTFIGTQIVTGSMYITNDLIVYGSSSLFNVTASVLDIGDNTIRLNTANPAVRFAGIEVIDSGSSQLTGSLLWDSQNNVWIYANPSGASYASARLIAGPKNTGSLGNESGLTAGYVPVASGDDHISNSIISASSAFVNIAGDLYTTGLISSSTITGIGNVSEYSQSVDSRLDAVESSIGGGGSLGTRVANLETISGSYLSFTQSYYTDSGSFNTRISASVAGYTANSASIAGIVNPLSASVFTQFSASTFTSTVNSASIAGIVNPLSASVFTQFSASTFTATANSASIADIVNPLSASVFTQFSASSATATANSASIAGIVNPLSASVFTQFSASTFTATANSASIAGIVNPLSASVFTQFSASTFTATANSASIAGIVNPLSASVFTQFSASTFTATANSASIAGIVNPLSASVFTQFSASSASQTALSSSVATTNNGQTDRIVKLEASQSNFDTAIGVSGTAVTIKGNLTVQGTTTQVDSTTVNINDNILTLNAAGTSDGGIIVRDAFGGTTNSGSLLWDVTNDYWKVGSMGAESRILTAGGMSIVSGSAQIDITSTTGYSTFSSSIATTNSASVATITANSASIAGIVNPLSASVFTQFSASAASVTALSSSVDSRLDTLEGTGTIQGLGTTNNVTHNSVTASLNVPSGGGNSKRLAFRGLTDSIEFITAPTTAGDIAQWDGTNFVMSNTIDGGSF